MLICFSPQMTMATEQTQSAQARPLRSNLLRKQSEIEEVDEEDTSPGSDQSDTTITAGNVLFHYLIFGTQKYFSNFFPENNRAGSRII